MNSISPCYSSFIFCFSKDLFRNGKVGESICKVCVFSIAYICIHIVKVVCFGMRVHNYADFPFFSFQKQQQTVKIVLTRDFLTNWFGRPTAENP
jgi:hypothetical protein